MRLYRYIKRDPKRFQEKISYLLNNLDFMKRVRFVRGKWNINKRVNLDKRMDDLLWDDNFDSLVTILINENNLTENWRDWLYRFIIYRDESNTFDADASIIVQEGGDFFVQVSPMTNLEEVKRAFRVIRKLQGTESKRLRLKVNIDRDKKVLRLARQGKTVIEIYRIMKQGGIDLDFGNIKNIVSRLQKKIKGKKIKLITKTVTDKPNLR